MANPFGARLADSKAAKEFHVILAAADQKRLQLTEEDVAKEIRARRRRPRRK